MPRAKKQAKHLKNICKIPKRVDVSEIAEPCDNKNVVTNERLLNLSNISEQDIITQVSSKSKFVLIDIDMVNTLLLSAACPECQQSQLKLNWKNNYGFAHKMELFCLNCNTSINSSYSSKRLEKTKGFEVNKVVTEAFLYFGKGYAAVEQFGMMLGMDVMSDKTFSEYTHIVFEDLKETTRKVMEDTRNRVKEAYRVINGNDQQQHVTDIAVSYDGSWHTRGHSSNHGIGCVIDMLTGYVIDFEVLTKFCHVCCDAKSLGIESAEYHIFMEGHKKDCGVNHTGSSNSMEVEACLKLWKRSESIGFRYTTMLSDGDSKAYNSVVESQVYGKDISVEKEECLNHVSKRLGTGLRNTVKVWKARGVTLGGRKHGSLKETTITKLQKYYQRAVLSNKGNLTATKTAIYATLFHSISTDEKPQHKKCPTGKDSWCFYQAAVATNKKPGSHKKCVGTPIAVENLDKLLPVYHRLATDDLLERCINCRTQNSNEGLHNLIWMRCPKTVFVSKVRVEIAVMHAVCHFNVGEKEALKISASQCVNTKISQRRHAKRAKSIKRRSNPDYQRMRQSLKRARLTKKLITEKKEGVTYAAGTF